MFLGNGVTKSGDFTPASLAKFLLNEWNETMTITVARPDAPEHFMVLRPINRRVVVRLPDGTKIAESTKATRLIESAKSIYDPVVYFPRDAITVEMTQQDNSTHCPLKGDATYFSVPGIDNLAWSYETPMPFSKEITGLVAFYGDKVIVEEHPIA